MKNQRELNTILKPVNLSKQQNHINEASTKAGFDISHLLTKREIAFTDSNLINDA